MISKNHFTIDQGPVVRADRIAPEKSYSA